MTLLLLEFYFIKTDRVNYIGETSDFKSLNEYQLKALEELQENFKEKQVNLLHGVTSSGKTEIYVELIKSQLEANKQVLYLLPEIALTTQLINRLQDYFGKQVSVFHSKYSMNERVEVWNNVLERKKKANRLSRRVSLVDVVPLKAQRIKSIVAFCIGQAFVIKKGLAAACFNNRQARTRPKGDSIIHGGVTASKNKETKQFCIKEF